MATSRTVSATETGMGLEEGRREGLQYRGGIDSPEPAGIQAIQIAAGSVALQSSTLVLARLFAERQDRVRPAARQPIEGIDEQPSGLLVAGGRASRDLMTHAGR